MDFSLTMTCYKVETCCSNKIHKRLFVSTVPYVTINRIQLQQNLIPSFLFLYLYLLVFLSYYTQSYHIWEITWDPDIKSQTKINTVHFSLTNTITSVLAETIESLCKRATWLYTWCYPKFPRILISRDNHYCYKLAPLVASGCIFQT